MALFCNVSCQKKAWKAGHKHHCTDLAARNQEHMLPYQVRVVRYKSGAHIENGHNIPAVQPAKTKQEKALLKAKAGELSECALDHYLSVVRHLTPEQLEQTYPLACIERWGDIERGPPHGDEDQEELGVVALCHVLDTYEDCQACGGDGQQFFSFCLNRPVNDNMVQHCEFCHKCFYFRPGCQKGCEHCGMGYYYDDGEGPEGLANAAGISIQAAQDMIDASHSSEMEICYAEDHRGCRIPRNPDYYTAGMAMEGFWHW